MDDSAEELELEALFDYSRVQPSEFICFDDDSDSEKHFNLSPKHENMKKTHVSESGIVVNPIVCEDNDEEDWLPSPPKVKNCARLEDSTIKELRLKKQELASFAQSAEDVLRAVEDSVRKQFASSLESSLESEGEKTSNPPVDREKIVISIQDKGGPKQYRMYMDEKFERIFKRYAEKVNLDPGSLSFSFDGDKISGAATPGMLGMENEDIIEVNIK